MPIILVGNREDLWNDEHTRWELVKMKQEPVKSEEGRDRTNRIGAFRYVECSSVKTKDGVREVSEMDTRATLYARCGKKNIWMLCLVKPCYKYNHHVVYFEVVFITLRIWLLAFFIYL